MEKEHASWDWIYGAACTYTHDKAMRARKTINYADLPYHINIYGDSFTHCDHVSDGETGQEMLGAHFGEPIQNFGCVPTPITSLFLRMKISSNLGS